MANRTFQRSRTPRRRAEWSSTVVQSSVLALGNAQSVGSVSVGIGFTESNTIARIRGHVVASQNTAAAANSMLLGIGLIVVSENAFTVGGAASMPGPLTDINASWLWHNILAFGPTQAGAVSDNAITMNQRVEIDSKAMRKVGPDDALAFIWEGLQLRGSPTADGTVAVRVMSLLH